MSITGTGNPRVRSGNPIGGIGGALYGVVGILAALRRRRHSKNGELVLKKLLNLSAQEWTSLREQKVTWWPTNGREYERPSIV